MTPRWAVLIPAAGSGRRMGGVRKPLLRLDGLPLVAHALQAFRGVGDVVIAVAPGDLRRWERLGLRGVRYVEGGARRQDSVAAALAAAPEATHVLVHDAARPRVTRKLVRAVMEATLATGAAVPGIAVADTLKRVRNGRVETTVPRDGLVRIQTPQGSRADWLRSAFSRVKADVTDEAMLLELCGRPVAVVPGDPANIKVTTKDDWKLLKQATLR